MSKTPIELIREATDDDETIHAVMLASETDDADYYIVLRSGVHDGHLMLKERYFVVRSDGTGDYMQNGINRRVPDIGPEPAKDFTRALTRGYARVSNDFNPSTEHSEGPLLFANGAIYDSDRDARDVMTSPVGEIPEIVAQSREDKPSSGNVHRSAEGTTPSRVVCQQCGREMRPEDGKNIGAGLGTDHWVHEKCPPEDDDE